MMAVQTSSNLPYSDLTPLERIEDQPHSMNGVQRMLLIDDDEIYGDDSSEEEEEDFTQLPTTQQEHTQYINSIRKSRPLPQIPQRSTSKELPQNMTEVFHDSFKNQNKLTAQQLFRMMCEHRSNQQFNQSSSSSSSSSGSDEESTHNDSDDSDDDYYDGVYALKTQLPSPEISKRLLHSSYHYDHFNSQAYKMMTPVKEVDEEEELYADYDFDSNTNDHASSSTTRDSRPLSEVSLAAPSFVSSLSESSDTNDVKDTPLNGDEMEENQSPQQQFYTPLYSNHDEKPSLVSDVQRLSQLNQALMTPVLSKTSSPFETEEEETSSNNTPMTSFSLTHDIKTYRRMATKTHDKNIQFTYAKYLLQLVASYNNNNNNGTRDLQEEAEYWIEKLAKGNHAEALYIKGQWHRHCFGGLFFVGTQYKKVNHNKAVKCFQQASKLGFTEAHYEMAEYYTFRKEYKKAMTSYRMAAIKNHCLSLYKLANILLRGLLHQERDVRQGMIFLKKAADLNKPESARSAYDLACIYANDLESIGLQSDVGFDFSRELAFEHFKKADELDLTVAAYRLGRLYEKEANTWEAFKCYYRAAEKRHEGAMMELSRLYKEGIAGYLEPHPTMAYAWCKRATENGNEAAEFVMGTYYEQGVGVPVDQIQARAWYNRAASKGYRAPQQQAKRPAHHDRKDSEKYFEESVRVAEKSRKNRAEQNCQIM